jgi:hypothetical protein
MIDRSTKAILLLIACGLWANVALLSTKPAVADSYALTRINDTLTSIRTLVQNTETNVSNIATGWCQNKKLC